MTKTWAGSANDGFKLDVRGAFLRRTDLSRASLRGANLSNADFSNSILQGADFEGAVLEGTILKGADLTGAINLSAKQLGQAILDENTKLPPEFSLSDFLPAAASAGR